MSTGVYLTGTLNLNGTYTYDLDVNYIRGADLNSLEGGTLYFSVAIPCGTPTNTTFEADVVGTYSNSQVF